MGRSIVELAAGLTTGALLVEYVGPADPQFMRLCRGRDALHACHTEPCFERAWLRRFDLLRRQKLDDSGRVLYHLALRG